jgi:autotransporter-associated beta strand protein
VVNNGTLSFNRGDALTVANAISGTGQLLHAGAGITTLTGANTYTGTTTISAGTLQIGNGGTTGSLGTSAVINNGTLSVDRNNTLMLANEISGTGLLIQGGPGITTLTGNNTYTGTTTINAGTLQIGDGGTSGTLGTGAVVNNATLSFNRSDALTVTNAISGTGQLIQAGPGTTTLTGTNTFAGTTTISAGTLQVGNGGTAGTLGTGVVINHGVLAFNRANTTIFGGDISGTGTVAQIGAGTTVLTGTHTYTGNTVISAGALQLGNGGTTGSIAGDVVDDSVLVFNRSDVVVFKGDISGSGAVIQAGPGTTILTGTNSYTGGTAILAGTLQVGDESVSESSQPLASGMIHSAGLKATNSEGTGQFGTGAMLNNGALVFNRSGIMTITNEMIGSGTVTQAGTGTLTLVGDKSYTGGTFVKSGTLALNGSLSGPVTVDRGATFAGTGTIFGSLMVNGGKVAPGSLEMPFSTLRVEGDLQLSPGAREVVRVDAGGNHAQLLVSGAATLTGSTLEVDPQSGSYNRVTFYPVLYADGGLTGTAWAASTNPGLEAWVTSTPKALALTLLNTELPLSSYATSPAAMAASAALDRLRVGATGDLAEVTRELSALDDSALALALESVAGEIHASAGQLAALDSEAMTNLVRDELVLRTTLDPPQPTPGRRHRMWARVQTLDSGFDRSSAHGGDMRGTQVAWATDWSRTDGWLFGIGGGYTQGTLGLEDLDESSKYAARRGFGYVGYAGRRSAVHAGASMARTGYEIRRKLFFTARLPETFGNQPVFGGVNREATSAPTETATDVWGNWSLSSGIGAWSISPSSGLRYARYSRHAWTESGAGSLSHSAPAFLMESAQADFGVRAARTFGPFRPHVSVIYRRELTDGDTLAPVQLSDGPDGFFFVNGAPLTRESTTTRAGVTFPRGALGLSLVYEARHAHRQTHQAVRFGLEF